MSIQEEFNKLLSMEPDELKKAIKDMTKEKRQVIIDMMSLPKNCSQKQLCIDIAETARFIRIANDGKLVDAN